MSMNNDPHRGQPVLRAGASFEDAKAAMIMIHGRGASAEDILTLADPLYHPDYVYVAPQAAGNTWYPYPFMQPIAQNEPYLSSALGVITTLIELLGEAGFGPDKIIISGFSQGACLATEYAARKPNRYGGVIGFSGGLIGDESAPRDYTGSLDGTPVFLGCSNVDAHIPKERVLLTAQVLRKLGGDVTDRLYPGMGHTINEDEFAFAREIMAALVT